MTTKFDIGQHIKLSTSREWNPIFKDAHGFIELILINEKEITYSINIVGLEYPYSPVMIQEKDLEKYE